MSHIPVLMDEVLTALSPKKGESYIDGTFGAGGYSRGILRTEDCQVIGLDRDPNVMPSVEIIQAEFPQRFLFVKSKFSDMQAAVNDSKHHGVVLDIGVSSMQIDQAGRGFSFMRDGPLDMRMSGQGMCAENVIKYFKHSELVEIFKVYGEERRARRCADFIVQARDIAPIVTTSELVDILVNALGKSGKTHPATRVFQALRIYINDELGELYRGLCAAEKILMPGGRLVVVSFHSLEDRIVKIFLRGRSGDVASVSRHVPMQEEARIAPSFNLSKRGTVKAAKKELSLNPRSRSARLRFGVRTQAPSWPMEENAAGNTALKHAPSLEVLRARMI